jgi:polyhydroxyalkanoate synthesis regulator phasin
MSQEILEALANENLQLVKMSMDHDSEISKEMIKLGKLRADFEKVLSEEEKEAFENMKNTSDSVSLNYATERFITGFRLGVMMMTEVFAGSDKLIIHE